jgi:type IV secretory pathway ATPase VirB11/archaellum biosynthesis ATPase
MYTDEILGIADQIELVYRDASAYAKQYKVNHEVAEKTVAYCSDLKDKAVIGNRTAVDALVDMFSETIINVLKLRSKDIPVNFKEPEQNPTIIKHELLLMVTDIIPVIKKYAINYTLTEKGLDEAVKENKAKIRSHFSTPESKIKFIAYLIYASKYGQCCMDSLQYQNINEIGVITSDYVYIIYSGDRYHIDYLCFNSIGELDQIQKKTTRTSSIPYDSKSTYCITNKDNSNRIAVVGHDSVPDCKKYAYYNERIFNLEKISLEELRDKYKTLDEECQKFLEINMKGKGSLVVTGPDMGVGKSTMLCALVDKIPNNRGIGHIDYQNELQLFEKYRKNILTLIVNPKLSHQEAFALTLKQARDMLIVGEVTVPAEVYGLVDSSLRLNCGVMATMHSYSPARVVTNLRNLMLRTEMYNDEKLAVDDITSGINLVIFMERHKTDRQRLIISSISIIVNRKDGYSVDKLFEYNYETDKWDRFNNLAEYYIEKVERYLTDDEINYLRGMMSVKS